MKKIDKNTNQILKRFNKILLIEQANIFSQIQHLESMSKHLATYLDKIMIQTLSIKKNILKNKIKKNVVFLQREDADGVDSQIFKKMFIVYLQNQTYNHSIDKVIQKNLESDLSTIDNPIFFVIGDRKSEVEFKKNIKQKYKNSSFFHLFLENNEESNFVLISKILTKLIKNKLSENENIGEVHLVSTLASNATITKVIPIFDYLSDFQEKYQINKEATASFKYIPNVNIWLNNMVNEYLEVKFLQTLYEWNINEFLSKVNQLKKNIEKIEDKIEHSEKMMNRIKNKKITDDVILLGSSD